MDACVSIFPRKVFNNSIDGAETAARIHRGYSNRGGDLPAGNIRGLMPPFESLSARERGTAIYIERPVAINYKRLIFPFSLFNYRGLRQRDWLRLCGQKALRRGMARGRGGRKRNEMRSNDRVPINIVYPADVEAAPTSNTLITSPISLVHHR